MSFDVETTGLRPYYGDRIFSYSYGNGNECVVRRMDDNTLHQIKTDDLIKCINDGTDIFKYITTDKAQCDNYHFLSVLISF